MNENEIKDFLTLEIINILLKGLQCKAANVSVLTNSEIEVKLKLERLKESLNETK